MGFFASLPIEQIMESVKHFVQEYAAKQNADFSEIYNRQLQSPSLECFKGDLKDTRSKQESLGSRICVNFANSLYTPRCSLTLKQSLSNREDQPLATKFLLLWPTLLSPTWNIKVSEAKMHAEELYIVTYVDNRLVLCGQHLADRWFMQEFLADFFYRHPVELEDVTNGEFLGTTLDANLRTLSFQQPTASFRFRPSRSAGTEAHKLSAAAARICLASRYSFPDHQARCDVQQLVRSYLEYDYPASKLKELADKFLRTRSYVHVVACKLTVWMFKSILQFLGHGSCRKTFLC